MLGDRSRYIYDAVTVTSIPITERMDLQTFDNTKLVAINTCPRWGLLRYGLHKVNSIPDRSLALEAGSACHDVFAGLRLFQLLQYDPINENSNVYRNTTRAIELFNYHGERLFGSARHLELTDRLKGYSNETLEDMAQNYCLDIFATSGYYDDPRDRRRTTHNIENSLKAYIKRWNYLSPIWIEDGSPTSRVGIELPFKIVIRYEYQGQLVYEGAFVGKIDGMHLGKKNDIIIQENKTTSKVTESYISNFKTASQVTGYMIAASAITRNPVDTCQVQVVPIPLPKTFSSANSVTFTNVFREPHDISQWFAWALSTIQVSNEYANDPYEAPKFTHSCGRYFRECMYLSLCQQNKENFDSWLDNMVEDEWNPLNDEA